MCLVVTWFLLSSDADCVWGFVHGEPQPLPAYLHPDSSGGLSFPQPKTLNPKLSGNPYVLCSFHADCLVLHCVWLLPSSDANCLVWV